MYHLSKRRAGSQSRFWPLQNLSSPMCPYFLSQLGKPALERMSAWHLVTAYLTDCRPSRLQAMGERWAKECCKNPDCVSYKQQKLSLADLSRERLFIVSQHCPGNRKSGSKDRWKHSPKHATEGILPPVGPAGWPPQLPLLLLPLQTGGCCCSHHQNNSSLSWV